jgi:hypothetical protein
METSVVVNLGDTQNVRLTKKGIVRMTRTLKNKIKNVRICVSIVRQGRLK